MHLLSCLGNRGQGCLALLRFFYCAMKITKLEEISGVCIQGHTWLHTDTGADQGFLQGGEQDFTDAAQRGYVCGWKWKQPSPVSQGCWSTNQGGSGCIWVHSGMSLVLNKPLVFLVATNKVRLKSHHTGYVPLANKITWIIFLISLTLFCNSQTPWRPLGTRSSDFSRKQDALNWLFQLLVYTSHNLFYLMNSLESYALIIQIYRAKTPPVLLRIIFIYSFGRDMKKLTRNYVITTWNEMCSI